MKVRIERRGGFAGGKAVGERNLEELSPDQRQDLEKLIATPPDPAPAPGADRFRYKLQVTDDKGKREIDVPEDAMPESLSSIPKIDF